MRSGLSYKAVLICPLYEGDTTAPGYPGRDVTQRISLSAPFELALKARRGVTFSIARHTEAPFLDTDGRAHEVMRIDVEGAHAGDREFLSELFKSSFAHTVLSCRDLVIRPAGADRAINLSAGAGIIIEALDGPAG